jgi:ubiquinol-cytochrome c reductase cytochrome b subunit
MSKLADWIDDRTDYRRLVTRFRKRSIPNGPSWWLSTGSCLLWLFVIEVVTGLALMAVYSPSMAAAWASVHYIDQSAAGSFLRGIHYYTSHALILMLLVHIARVVWTAAFRPPRELIWITGLLLIPLTVVWTATGNPLSAHQKGISQIDVEGKIIASTPFIGPLIQRLLIGGNEPGNLTLTHLYFLHVGLLPLLALLLLGIHISQVYRHGFAQLAENGAAGETLPYWPYQSIRNLTVLSIVVGIVAYLSWSYGAPLEAPADANLLHTPRPEWYFRWLFELRQYLGGQWEFLATVVLPLVLLAYFVLLPIIDGALKRGPSFVLRVLTVCIGTMVVGGLTWVSFARDWNDAQYIASQAASQELAARARFLAKGKALPVDGAVTLLRDDPKTQGPLLYERHCASCHPYTDEHGQGIVAEEVSAPNLYGFGTPQWIAGVLHADRFVSAEYFGKTKFVDGDMARWLRDTYDAADDVEKLREQLILAARTLSAEADLLSQASYVASEAAQIATGAELIKGEFFCIDCHHYGDAGELGAAPDLSGYASREWLIAIIANPQHERFYPDDRNDRMPSFGSDQERPEQNILSPRELDLLVSWLRGEWLAEE